MEKNFSNEDSLQLINTMVRISRQNLRNGGLYYILYGSVFFAASLFQFFLYKVYKTDLHWLSWMGAGIVAIFISFFLRRKTRRSGEVATYLTRLNRFLWTAFVFSVLFVVFLAIFQFISFKQINPLIMMLYGFATLITGGMLKFKWMIVGAVLAWVLALFSSFQEYSVQMLLVSLTILVAYLIPGIILNYSWETNA